MILDMDESLIKEAAKSLKIQTVNLLESRIQCGELTPINLTNDNSEVKIGRGLIRFSSFELEDDQGKAVKAVSFVYQCGLKVSKKTDKLKEDNDFLAIEVSFSALYLLNEELSDECLTEFGKHNVPYHVWPYWREYAQSTLMRMGVNPVHIPFYQVS